MAHFPISAHYLHYSGFSMHIVHFISFGYSKYANMYQVFVWIKQVLIVCACVWRRMWIGGCVTDIFVKQHHQMSSGSRLSHDILDKTILFVDTMSSYFGFVDVFGLPLNALFTGSDWSHHDVDIRWAHSLTATPTPQAGFNKFLLKFWCKIYSKGK